MLSHIKEGFIFLIGHRGVGKTTFLKKLNRMERVLPTFDLDHVIEVTQKKTISDIFQHHGESYFREVEKKVLQEIIRTNPRGAIVALGAGFPLRDFSWPTSSQFIWVRRATDACGRIFLDRPQLNYLEKYHQRDPIFAQMADLIVELPEGFEFNSWKELSRHRLSGGIVTLTPWFLEKTSRLTWLNTLSPSFIEIRDDLLSPEQYAQIRPYLHRPILFSLRKQSWRQEEWLPFSFIDVDQKILSKIPWDHTLFHQKRVILSSHDQTPPSDSALPQVSFFKWSPVISSWSQLSEALAWQQKNPSRHLLAPRIDPHWQSDHEASWVRQLLLLRQRYHYLRCDPNGSHPQQIHWTQYLHLKPIIARYRQVPGEKPWFAVLGSPIMHSYSPEMHRRLNRYFPCLFLKIPLRLEEFSEGFRHLMAQGLVGGALTSPLKQALNTPGPINTFFVPREHRGHNSSEDLATYCHTGNTDLHGFASVLKWLMLRLPKIGFSQPLPKQERDFICFVQHQVTSQPLSALLDPTHTSLLSIHFPITCLIFGGGGLLPSLKQVLPNADHLAARTEPDQVPQRFVNKNYDLLIWAAPPQASHAPLKSISFQLILDMNYHEWCQVRSLALERRVPYISGRYLFIAQALYQQALFQWWHSTEVTAS